MFTGLIEEMGSLGAVRQAGRSLHIAVKADKVMAGLELGDSVAVSGVCLTVVARDAGTFTADVMPETYQRTTLRHLGPGARVNLERCLQVGGRLGGHMVQGHVDGVGQVADLTKDEIALWVTIVAPPAVMRYVVPKGSIAVDGISLTVVDRTADRFRVGIIPHTAAVTTMGQRRVGDPVNLEGDIIGKYVDQFVAARVGNGGGSDPDGGFGGGPDGAQGGTQGRGPGSVSGSAPDGVSAELLRRTGFIQGS